MRNRALKEGQFSFVGTESRPFFVVIAIENWQKPWYIAKCVKRKAALCN
jgi:hypothetical protein